MCVFVIIMEREIAWRWHVREWDCHVFTALHLCDTNRVWRRHVFALIGIVFSFDMGFFLFPEAADGPRVHFTCSFLTVFAAKYTPSIP